MADLKKFIVPVVLENTDEHQKMGNKKFNTTDLVFINSYDEIETLKKHQRLISATDYALANGDFQTLDPKTKIERTTHPYYLRSAKYDRYVTCVYGNGSIDFTYCKQTYIGVCPSMHLNLEAILEENKSNTNFFKAKPVKKLNGEIEYYIVEFGEYPKTKTINSDILENYFLNKNPFIKPTGKKYIGSFDNYGNYLENIEYKFMGEKYARVKINNENSNNNTKAPTNSNYIWIKVEPITWIIKNWDEMPKEINSNGNGNAKYISLRSEKLIIGGIPFYPKVNDINISYWQNSTIRGMLNSIDVCNIQNNGNEKFNAPNGGNFSNCGFLHEAFDSSQTLINKKSRLNQSNPYGFVYDDLSNDDLLKLYIKSNASVFLHGPSGVGKSGRVKQLDPTATRITLRPQMNPEEIDGTLDRETGEYIEPLWYKQLTEKCKAEPDRKHILFIDELTNVKPTVQSLIYSIVLDRAGKDGLWPLPDNAVVVAAGNESAGNLAAYPLTNALFRRFNHIYYEVDKENWLDWATGINKLQKEEHIENKTEQRAKVHPAIVTYIMSRDNKILNQDLDEENPKIVTDPRKWEIASNVLYSTKNPKALLPAIGEELTADFVDFVQSIQLSVEDVLTNNYDKQELQEMDVAKKLSTLVGLCTANEKDLSTIRKFVANTMGKEILATYDSLWIRNDPERAEIIAENNIDLMEGKKYDLEH